MVMTPWDASSRKKPSEDILGRSTLPVGCDPLGVNGPFPKGHTTDILHIRY